MRKQSEHLRDRARRAERLPLTISDNLTPPVTRAAASFGRTNQQIRRFRRMKDLFLVVISSSTALLFVAFALAAWMR
jgi:hypothetical protein